jgi:hypothetical protein
MAPFFMVSKQNLNPSYWHIWCIKNCQRWNVIEKVMAAQSKGGQKLKKTTTKHYKGEFPNTQKIPCILFCCYQSFKMICRTSSGALITL